MIKLYLAKEFLHFEGAVQFNETDFQRNYYMTVDQFDQFRHQHQQYGIFTTAYRYDQENIREANMIGNLYIDFDITDIDTNFQNIKADAIRVISAFGGIFGIKKEMIRIYFSGSKGVHLVIPAEIMGITPHKELNMIFRLIADDMKKLVKHDTVDTRIYDKVRLFRVPNSIHPVSGLYKVQLTFEELRDYSLEEIRMIASEPRRNIKKSKMMYVPQANRIYQSYIQEWEEKKKRDLKAKEKAKEKTLNFRPPCIDHLLTEGAVSGKRNNTVAVLASYLMQRGLKENDAIHELIKWNQEFCSPSLPDREIEKTVRSIYSSGYKYGCYTLKDLSICQPDCRIYK